MAKHNPATVHKRRPKVERSARLEPVTGRSAPRSMRLPELDRLIHERIRLGIISALAVNDVMSFTDLKELLQTTDGNLSVHARKLEEANYVACAKYFEDRLPKTEFRLTSAGRRAFERYLNHMEALIRAVGGGSGTRSGERG